MVLPIPWFGLAVAGLSLLPQIGQKARKQKLKDLNDCPEYSDEGRASHPRSYYCWYRGKLLTAKPVEIAVEQGGHPFRYRFAKYQYRSYQLSRVLTASGTPSTTMKESDPASGTKTETKVESQTVQQWKRKRSLMQESPIVYGTGLSIDRRFQVDSLRNKIQMKRLQTILTNSPSLQSASDNKSDDRSNGGGNNNNISVNVNVSSGGGSGLSQGAIGEGAMQDEGYEHELYGIEDQTFVTVVGELRDSGEAQKDCFVESGMKFSTIDERTMIDLIQACENDIWLSNSLSVAGLILAGVVGIYEIKSKSAQA